MEHQCYFTNLKLNKADKCKVVFYVCNLERLILTFNKEFRLLKVVIQ